MSSVKARREGSRFGSGFMRDVYSETYSRFKGEDSPELAKESARRALRRLSAGIAPGGSYLGIGAGSGFTEAGMKQHLAKFSSVVILDIAKRRPKMRREENVLNVEADAMFLPVKSASVDLASCLMSQDFYEDRGKATREMLRVLKPGGHAVVFLHHEKMLRANLSCGALESRQAAFTHSLLENGGVFRDAGEIREHYESNGFQVLEVGEHVPGKFEPRTDYWWEAVLRKPQAPASAPRAQAGP
jgi:ubiquinone/menaquinone biosynthesis C-methylase UbiE